jgi:hypothetical protein
VQYANARLSGLVLHRSHCHIDMAYNTLEYIFAALLDAPHIRKRRSAENKPVVRDDLRDDPPKGDGGVPVDQRGIAGQRVFGHAGHNDLDVLGRSSQQDDAVS